MSTKQTIVIIDDEPPVTTLFGALFRRAGFETKTFADGSEILSWLTAHDCDAVLIDLQMPGFDGFTLLCLLKERFPTLPIIIFSGLPCTLEEEAALNSAGASGFIRKTSPFEESLQTVRIATSPRKPAKRLLLSSSRLSAISAVITRRIQRLQLPQARHVPAYLERMG